MSAQGTRGDEIRIPEPQPDVVHPMAEFFNHQRRRLRMRKDARVPRSSGRRAVVTMVHNEAVFLPIWLRYYSRFFSPEDIYVLDHETTDGSTDREASYASRSPTSRVDHAWMASTDRAGCSASSSTRHDVVLATDVDEIVAPDPQRGTWASTIDRFGEEVGQLPTATS